MGTSSMLCVLDPGPPFCRAVSREKRRGGDISSRGEVVGTWSRGPVFPEQDREVSDMEDIATLLLDPETSVAVVGATDDPLKYGSVIYRDLKNKGFEVWPVNPHRQTVDGDRTYARLADLPEAPTIVNYVVPEDAALVVLHDAKTLGYLNAWVQPGAESPAVLRFLQEHSFNYLANACIMVQSRARAG
jgi:predicted CoA-binding protein